MAVIPVNRCTEYITNDDGTRTYTVYNKTSPHYYQDITGSLHPIDTFYSQSKNNSNISSFQLYDKKY